VPREVKTAEDFIRLAERAEVCLVKRMKETVKLKLRTPRYLYTLKTTPEEAEDLLKKIKCPVQET